MDRSNQVVCVIESSDEVRETFGCVSCEMINIPKRVIGKQLADKVLIAN